MVELFDPVYKILFLQMENAEDDGQSILAIKNVLLEYQKEASIIDKQLKTCLKDHDFLKRHSKELVDENRRLLKLLKDKCENESGSQSLMKLEESLMVRNLQHQLSLTANERDTIKEMWVLSCNTVEDLQNELRCCKEQMESKAMFKQIDGLKRDYSDAIGLLEKKLNIVKEELDKQKGRNVELDDKIKYLQQEVDDTCEKNKSLQSKLIASAKQNEELKDTCLTLESKCAHLDSLTGYQKRDGNKDVGNNELQKVKADRNELQKALEHCHSVIETLSQQSLSGRDKVEEAVKLVEEAVRDRDSILLRAERAEEECRRLQMEIQRLIDEAGLQIGRELAANKEQYSNEIISLQMELKIAKQDSANKSAEVAQLTKECKRLENLLMQTNLASDSTKLEKKLDKLVNSLHVLENTYLQVVSENDDLKKSLESMYERYRRCKLEKAMLSEEILSNEKLIENLTRELEIARESTNNISAEIQNINLESCHEFRNESDRLLLILQEIQDKNVAATKELHRHVEAHNDIARKWKSEMEALTNKLERKIQKSKSDKKKEKKKSNESVKTETLAED